MPASTRLDDRRAGRGIAASTIAALSAALLGAGCTNTVSGRPASALSPPAAPPASETSTSAPASPTQPGVPSRDGRTYRISSDRGGFLVTSRQGGTTQQWRTTDQTWTHTFYPPGAGPLPVIRAVAEPSASFIECTVTAAGVTVARIRSGGPDARVECS